MKSSRSQFVPIRGLRYHVRTWGDPAHRPVFFLHGWMDVSASFQFVVDALAGDWHVIAPDWRGFGLTDWAPDGYWFPDYFADLDALVDRFSSTAPVSIVGHSMGGNVAGIYAGVRPERVAKLVLAEGFGLKPTDPSQAPERFGRWLENLKSCEGFRSYATLADVAARLRKTNPRLPEDKARYLAPHWSMTLADGSLAPAADPRHKDVNPVLYRQEEALACWQRITAPTLWLWGGDPEWMKHFAGDNAEDWARRRAAFARLSECRIPGAGHMMHHDEPVTFAREIETFLLAP